MESNGGEFIKKKKNSGVIQFIWHIVLYFQYELVKNRTRTLF